MHESKEFKKGINQLEWELKEMFMKAEDLQTAALDLQLLRVTKDLQVYLSDTDQRQSKQQETGTLEKTLEMYQQVTIGFHQANVLLSTQIRIQNWTNSCHLSFSIPPENIRKPVVFPEGIEKY